METKHVLRIKRKARIRAKISGDMRRPRLSMFKSNKAILAQIVDDTKGVTLLSVRVIGKNKEAGKLLGEKIAKAAVEKKIKTMVFDRGGYRFHGVVKEVADAVRKGGITI